ncbi:MAG: hypothetical protein COV66_03595 [Nitrospinae bacterium CG11_big_fil_rev_8_21_14_0_20_45_15]|nr:MAG: hypothetical protein COV66_03595 [Nitrospinae bacterium CG11_big_fil_rev_8_21_14_0_20_45_15]
MENYPRLFIKAGLIYFVLGIVLGVKMAFVPGGSIRFVHIHLNLLGFMTMMIAGVSYHVLPRFSARAVPWPEGVKYHFILHNVGLMGMLLTYLLGGMTGGLIGILFGLFSLITGVGLLIMCYNLYFVLTDPKPLVSKITGKMTVARVLGQFPQTLNVFLDNGFSALANPNARATFAKVVSVETACSKHGVDSVAFIEKLNSVIHETTSAETTSTEEVEPKKEPSGREIHRGEECKPDVLVGSLIKTYPTTKAVFEKHYGEGCFSCPGQSFEQVQETASMHNIEIKVILDEINEAITKDLEESRSIDYENSN